MQQAYADFLRQMAVHAAQRQQMADIAMDPTRPRWARVPRGRVTCAFCTMLAGRGFVYTSEEAAGGGLGSKYHNHCDCEPVPTWGEAKLTGYDPDKLDALYRRAREGLPEGASYRDVLSRMRANGGVTDSPAAPGGGSGGKPPKTPKAEAGSGGGGRKPPKTPKATAGTPEPEEPKSEGYGGEGEDPAKASKQVLRRSMCRASVEKGNVASQYRAAVAAGETRGFDAWLGDMVAREVATRDPDWVSGAVDECRIAKRPGARPWKKEKRTAAVLARNGFGVEFIPEIDKTHVKTPDAVLNDGLEWEFKVPDGWNPEKTIKNQFKKATGKGTSKLVISNFQNKADGSEMREKIAEFMETDDFQEIDEVLFVDVADGSVTRFRR
ncbi:MAG: hypothetical protein PUF97_03650 [Bifidobacteriaceae bacterium]|nr:hypothetical protein [Bifidobacteriaceae bacterium]